MSIIGSMNQQRFDCIHLCFIQAFSTDEVNIARQKFDQLAKFQVTLDELWRGTRWTMDIITYARDRSTASGTGGLPLNSLFSSL